jgi:hypothetical protein
MKSYKELIFTTNKKREKKKTILKNKMDDINITLNANIDSYNGLINLKEGGKWIQRYIQVNENNIKFFDDNINENHKEKGIIDMVDISGVVDIGKNIKPEDLRKSARKSARFSGKIKEEDIELERFKVELRIMISTYADKIYEISVFKFEDKDLIIDLINKLKFKLINQNGGYLKLKGEKSKRDWKKRYVTVSNKINFYERYLKY